MTTPRTDSAEPYGPPYSEVQEIHVPKTFARQVEHELNEAKRLALAGYELLESIRSKVGLAKLIDLGTGTGLSQIGYASYLKLCEDLKGGAK